MLERIHISTRYATALLAGVVTTACGGGAKAPAAPPQMPPPGVAIVTVQPQRVPQTYDLPGQVEPYRRAEVRARVDGVIDARTFTEGTVVRRGDTLYKLDRVKYDAAYRAAVARLDNAKRTMARLQPLVAKHAVAQQDVDNATSELESAQAATDAAKKDLDDTYVLAELDGQVGQARLDVGSRVTGSGDVLTTIDQIDPIYVTFRPSTDQLLAWRSDPASQALLSPGGALAVRIVLPNGTLAPESGSLNFVSSSIDSTTGTQIFRARFSNGDHRLVPGQFVRVRLTGFVQNAALTIPQRAVQQGLGRQFVYVVGPGDTATARDVHPGAWVGTNWVIDSGLVAGDRVIVDGIQKVQPGKPVKPSPLVDSVAQPKAGGRG